MNGSTDAIRVLHVDDDPDFAELAATFLERQDDRLIVETATSASDGLERFEAASFDAVVSDYDMPGQTGIEVLETVRESHPDLPFILFTGKGSEEVASDAISAGVTDYLQKGPDTSRYEVLANRLTNAVEQYRAQQALEASQKRLSLFIDQSPLGVIEWDEHFDIVRVNDAAEEILGYSEADLQDRSWEALVPESDLPDVDTVVSNLLENEGGYHSTNENVRADGERIVCEWHNRVVTDDAGDVVAIFSQFQDVTERRNRREAVEELHRRTEAIFTAETPKAVAEVVVEAVRDILDMPANAVHLREPAEPGLRPVAWTERVAELVDEIPTFTSGDGLAWDVYETGEPQLYHDIREVPGRYSDDTEIRSEILLPLAEHGVILIGSTEPEAYNETDVSLAQLLAVHATTALDLLEQDRELGRQRMLLEAQQEAVLDGMVVIDESGEIISYNDRFLELWDVTEAMIDGANDAVLEWMAQQMVDPEAFRETVEQLEDVPDATERDEMDLADGRTLERYTTPLNGTEGGYEGRLWTFRDVTDRQRRERRLAALQQRTQTLMHTATKEETAQLAVDTAHEVLEAPLSGFHLLSDDGETLEPIAFVDTVREELDELPAYHRGADPDSDPTSAVVWEAFESGDPLVIDDTRERGRLAEVTPARTAIIHPLADYGVFIVSATQAEEFDETDSALMEILANSLTAALDRVEREARMREREESLEIERDRLRSLFELIPEPITHVEFEDDDPIILDVNRAFADTFGADDATAVGESVNDVIVPPDRAEQADAIDDLVFEKGTVKQEVRRETIDGPGDFLFRSVPVGTVDETDEFLGVYIDISERKAAQRRLEEQNARLKEFASVVSHDLRNPLNVAEGRLELAREDCDSDQLDAVAGAHERMRDLINDLLAVARHTEIELETETIDLEAALDQCWQNVRTADADLVASAEGRLVADPGRLQRLFENLIRNAIDHGGSAVTVTVGDLRDGFYFADDGPGIRPDERDRVFDAGYTSSADGNGIGLSIVSDIADAHGWDVAVTESETGGARFEITGVDVQSD